LMRFCRGFININVVGVFDIVDFHNN
jgi:hypothetical protein